MFFVSTAVDFYAIVCPEAACISFDPKPDGRSSSVLRLLSTDARLTVLFSLTIFGLFVVILLTELPEK